MAIWGDFQGLTEVTGGGWSKNWKIGVTSFMDGPLSRMIKQMSRLAYQPSAMSEVNRSQKNGQK